MSSLSIGLSSLLVNQRLLDLTGQNIANANTPGYHRQVADLAARNYGTEIGAGVQLQLIRRPANGLLEEAVYRNTADTGSVTAQMDALQQAQSYLSADQGSLSD